MKNVRPVFSALLGVFMLAAAVAMLVHDGKYILTGNTVDLNQILCNGEKLPRDQYVTYTCAVSLGNYGETTLRYGFIPLPGKTEQFAFLTENNMIMSAEIGKKALIQEMQELTDSYFWEEETEAVVLTGCFETNSADMNRFLREYFAGTEYEEQGITLTSYVINTTKTRPRITVLYLLMLALGAAVLIVSIKKWMAERGQMHV